MSKKVALLGFGIEGRAAWRYFRDQGADITILSEDQPSDVPEGVAIEVGSNIFERAFGYDLVVRSPSIRPDRIKTDGEVTSTTKLFFQNCKAPIIGITASKGKGTIATLIANMLSSAAIKAHLVGNIGIPAIEKLEEIAQDDVVVFELSSFQLWDMTQSPHIAVIGMIEPDHLDVHRDFAEYRAAKANIAKWQHSKDIVVYHPTNPYAHELARFSPGTLLRYGTREGAYIENEQFKLDEQVICGTADVQIPGKHNLENICAAITAAWCYAKNISAFAQAIKEYKGLEHRLEFVRELEGVKYYDDSFSSAPGAAIVAAQAFEAPKVMILGGFDRGIDFQPMIDELVQANVKKLLLIGQTAPKLAAFLQKTSIAKDAIEQLGSPDMKTIVRRAHAVAQPGDIVLFSPGCPSFDMFKNFKERGKQFQEEVISL